MDDKQVLKVQVDQLIAAMAKVNVDSDETYQFMAGWLKRNKDTQKLISDAFEADRVEAKSKYDAILAAKSAFIKPLETAEKITRERMTVWSTERERVRRAEEARVIAEHKKEAEDNLLETADTLVSMGRTDQAEALMDRGARVSKVAVAQDMTTTKVGKTMERWVVAVTDKKAFLAEAIKVDSILDCIDINISKLTALCKASKSTSGAGLDIQINYVPVL